MSNGMITFTELGLADQIERYVSFEYDVKSVGKKGAGEFGFPALTASHNFPNIEQRGDIFKADFIEFKGFDYILAGFPCTKFSIAQKVDRETKPYSGEGWDMFEKAWEAVQIAQPKFFLFENNKSMATEVKEEISRIIGFSPVLINSALVSAQTRQRIYWLGKRNPDGTYSQVHVEQPEDRGILLKDVLEHGIVDKEKSYVLKHQSGNTRDYFKKHHTQIVFEPVRVGDIGSGAQAHRVYSCYGKSVTINSGGGGQGGKTGLYFVPIPEELVNDICDKGLIYEVRNNEIETKHGVFYVNLPDGYYLIRKLTVKECMRLQTVPEWYDFSVVSQTAAYAMLGNGWTVEVIKYLISHTLE